jgi:hypothetical protein
MLHLLTARSAPIIGVRVRPSALTVRSSAPRSVTVAHRREEASLRAAAAELEADGVPTSRPGSTWRASMLARVLDREAA